MHAKYFQEPKGDTICTKHQEDQEVTQRCENPEVVQIISKNQFNTRLTPKSTKWTKQTPMSIKDH
jgi:hypothetical protein